MARRLAPEERRDLIVRQTRQMIAEEGTEGLSFRAVARYCGMSAPGVLHYFDSLTPLLEAVLDQREEEERAAFLEVIPENPTLLEWADTVVRVSMSRAKENHNFDIMEAQAMGSPEHPAYDWYARRPHHFEETIELAKKDYPRDPDAVLTVLGTVVDGLRFRWIRSAEVSDYASDWKQVRDTVFAGFEQYRA